MSNGREEKEKRQSKRADIDEILQHVENYANESRVGAEELSIVLLQERVPNPESEIQDSVGLSPDERSLGWLDNLIKKLLKVELNLEKTSVSLSMLHKELSSK